ncbi:MAG: TatD family hydrolase [Clostridia bacterium]|nr:TatD family hydrolase [Clostridia bacterium]
MSYPIFDTHAHYLDGRFEREFEGGTDGAIKRAMEEGVGYFLNASVTLEDSRRSIDLAHRYDTVYAAAGIHPEDCEPYDITRVDEVMAELESLLCDDKVVAIGEIGLDYHWEVPHDLQKIWFEAQMTLARDLDMPVIIHDREAHGDVTDTLLRYPAVRGILHSYSGSAEMAKELVKYGWYISFSGTLTFKNARKPAEVVAAVPYDRMLVETDCPYLAPHPHRGKINYSGYLVHTVAKLAELAGLDFDEACRITTENAKTIYNIKE